MRCPPALLDDLRAVLADLRHWTGVAEKKPGIFYVGGQPFLHFHLEPNGRRRADIKGHAGWHPFPLPRPLSPTRRRAFVRALHRRHAERQPPA
jgi:hypothetical protein